MKKYFYAQGNQSFGPYDLNELRHHTITRETMVWFQELGNWTPAGNVRELNELFVATPPPLIVNQPPQNNLYNTSTPPPITNTQSTESNSYNNQPNIHHDRAVNSTNIVMPKTWLVESIIVTILFLSPLAAIGIYKASKVHARWQDGDFIGAKIASNQARNLTLIALVLGLIVTFYLINN